MNMFSKTLISVTVASLLAGCNNILDTTPPQKPKNLSQNSIITNKKSVDIKISGEEGCRVFIDGEKTQNVITKNDKVYVVNSYNSKSVPGRGEIDVTLDLSNLEGKKDFKIALGDSANNLSEPIIIEVDRDSTPPKIPTLLTKEPLVTNNSFIDVEIKGEEKAKIFVNSKDINQLIEDEKAILRLPLQGNTLYRDFNITLEDSLKNISQPLTLKVHKDLLPPKEPTLAQTNFITNQNEIEVEIKGEERAKVYLNDEYTNIDIKDGVAKIKVVTQKEDGKRSFYVNLVDRFDNKSKSSEFSIEKDSTPPAIALLKSENLKTNRDFIEIEIEGEEGSEIFIDEKSSGIIQNGKSKLNLDLSGEDGERDFNITLKDSLLNQSEALVVKIIKDTKAPNPPEFIDKLVKITNKDEVNLKLSVEENSTLFVNNKEFAKSNSSEIEAFFVLNEGKNEFAITLKDELENESEALKFEILKDITPPQKALVREENIITNQDSVDITVVAETESKVFVNSKETNIAANSLKEAKVSLNTSGIDGTKSYTIELEDEAGNRSEAYIYTLTKDVTPPQKPTFLNPPTKIKTDTFDVTLIGEEDSILYIDDNESNITLKDGKANLTLDALKIDGEIKYAFALKDKVGNLSQISLLKVTKDSTPPSEVEFIEPIKETNQSEVTLLLKGENNASVYVNETLTTQLNENGEGNITLDLSGEDGEFRFDIALADDLNNTNQAKLLTLLKDSTPPKKPIINQVAKFTTKDSEEVSISGDINSTIFINRENSQKLIDNENNTTISLDTSGEDGVKTYELTLKDRVGNESENATISIIKDTLAPTKPILSFIEKTNKNSIEVSIEGEENTTIYLNDKKFTSLDIAKKVLTLDISSEAEGEINYELFLEDEANNQSEKAFVKIIKDTTPPQKPTLFKDINSTTTKESIEIQIQNREKSEVFVNGKKSENVLSYEDSSAISLDLKEGENSFAITLKDELGNESEALTITIEKIIEQKVVDNNETKELFENNETLENLDNNDTEDIIDNNNTAKI